MIFFLKIYIFLSKTEKLHKNRKRFISLVCNFILRLIVNMSICICSSCILRMSKLFLNRFHAESQAQEHRCAAMTQVMKSYIRQIILTNDFLERMRYIVRSIGADDISGCRLSSVRCRKSEQKTNTDTS